MSWWRAFGPAMARPGKADMLRGGLGAGLGLLIAALAVHLAEDSRLIAPLGASAVMVFVLPNSPLAQPWSVVVGNCAATLVAILLVALLPAAPWVGPVVVAAGLLAMHALRALHPPGGAMAFLVALGGGGEPIMVLAVAALGSVVLVGTAMLWHRATGRVYPFRQPSQPGRHGTRDPAATRAWTAGCQAGKGGARARVAGGWAGRGATAWKGGLSLPPAVRPGLSSWTGGRPAPVCKLHQSQCPALSWAGWSWGSDEPSALTQTMPEALQISIHSDLPAPPTAACTRAGHSAATSRAQMASQAAKRRCRRIASMAAV